jgi:hypothetical protein
MKVALCFVLIFLPFFFMSEVAMKSPVEGTKTDRYGRCFTDPNSIISKNCFVRIIAKRIELLKSVVHWLDYDSYQPQPVIDRESYLNSTEKSTT